MFFSVFLWCAHIQKTHSINSLFRSVSCEHELLIEWQALKTTDNAWKTWKSRRFPSSLPKKVGKKREYSGRKDDFVRWFLAKYLDIHSSMFRLQLAVNGSEADKMAENSIEIRVTCQTVRFLEEIGVYDRIWGNSMVVHLTQGSQLIVSTIFPAI